MTAPTVNQPLITEVELWGGLGRKVGKRHRLALDTGKTWEIFKALEVTLQGFKEEIGRLHRLGMRFAVFRNGKNIAEKDFELGGTQKLKIVPVIGGSKRAGVLQTVLGIVLIVVGAYTKNPNLVAAGVAMTAGGVIQMLSPQLSGLKQSASPDNQPSYAFGSATNTTASGNPVPICIGERRWGGAIISASIYAEDKA